mmetsp:Transcript_7095/g.10444  ORF Transcript_7095/g.10444 Transcript_7095/m.10444 type:complete len:225 (+) Transcript_7095:941-1615(+)
MVIRYLFKFTRSLVLCHNAPACITRFWVIITSLPQTMCIITMRGAICRLLYSYQPSSQYVIEFAVYRDLNIPYFVSLLFVSGTSSHTAIISSTFSHFRARVSHTFYLSSLNIERSTSSPSPFDHWVELFVILFSMVTSCFSCLPYAGDESYRASPFAPLVVMPKHVTDDTNVYGQKMAQAHRSYNTVVLALLLQSAVLSHCAHVFKYQVPNCTFGTDFMHMQNS